MSRRTFIISAAASSVPAGLLANKAVAAPRGHDDSELISLVQEWMQGEARLVELFPIQDEAEARYVRSLPKRPRELHVKAGDLLFSMPFSGEWTIEMQDGEKRVHVYTQRAIEDFRSTPRMMNDWSNTTGDDETGYAPARVPDPKAQARADEIVAAWDRYCDAVEDVREQSGCAAAREAVFNLSWELKELEERIAHTPATTPQGLLFKAKMIAFDPAYAGIEEQFENALQARESTGHFMGLSLVRDLLNMNRDTA